MKAWGHVLFAGGLTAMGLLAPWPFVALLAAASWAATGFSRGFLAFAVITLVVDAALLGWLDAASVEQGVRRGLVAGARVVAVVGVNWAIFRSLSMPSLVDGLRLPRRATAFIGAVLIAAEDLRQDLHRVIQGRRLDGAWPDRRLRRATAAAALLPTLMVTAWHRGQRRQEAVRAAGMQVGPRFAPIVAVTALAMAGRLAFIAIPNVALTYAIVFAGGIAFGGRVGAWSGLWSMALSNVFISGLAPSPFVNAPAMALVGWTGGWFSTERRGEVVLAACTGFAATMAFSILTDTMSWLLIPEYRTSIPLLQVRLVAGLVFNVIPALTNAWLFAAAVGPVRRAFEAIHGRARTYQ